MDNPIDVARQIAAVFAQDKSDDVYLGWPKKLFVYLNPLLPRRVDGALRKQLPVVRRFAETGRTATQGHKQAVSNHSA